jgi:hypothetical protein
MSELRALTGTQSDKGRCESAGNCYLGSRSKQRHNRATATISDQRLPGTKVS